MRQIEVDQEVFSFLQKRAVPFLDSPNDVLRRLLSLAESPEANNGIPVGTDQSEQPRPRDRRKKPDLTPQPQFRVPILKILSDFGGRARAGDVLDRLPER